MALRVSQIVQYVALGLSAIALVLVIVALCFPWYSSKLDTKLNGDKYKVGTSLHPFYGWYSCSGKNGFCDNVCTGLHGWSAVGKDCKSVDVDTGNSRALYVFCWLFDLVALAVIGLVIVLLAPAIGDKIQERLPPAVRGFGPLAIGLFGTFWLVLSFLVFWMFLTTAACNDSGDKDCDISFWESEGDASSGPSWGWYTTMTASILLLLASVAAGAQGFLARKEEGGEYATIGGGSASYT